jgi:hypothetical protein
LNYKLDLNKSIYNFIIKMNSEYFRNRFAKHDVAIKELTKEIIEVVPKKIYSRKKRNYQEAFVKPDLQKK